MKHEHFGKYHAVGQGLFHSANVTIGDRFFSYVYDCGNVYPGRHLESAIASFCEQLPVNEGGLSLLVLSHLHWDHVSGVNLLLNKVKKIKVAILPYLCPAERMMVLSAAIKDYDFGNNDSDWYRDFIRRPALFLLRNGVQKVVFIRGGDQTDYAIDKQPHPPKQPRNLDSPIQFWNQLEELTNKELDEIVSWEESASGDIDDDGTFDSTNITFRTSRGAVGYGPWCFLFYNMNRDSNTIRSFVSEFKIILDGKRLPDFLKSDLRLETVRSAYSRCFPNTSMNELSLAMFVGALSQRAYTHSRLQGQFNWFPTDPKCFVGSLLTGDLPVKKVWPALSDKFGLNSGKLKTQLVTYQVPHHGADSCWSSEQSLAVSGCFIIPAGINNRYGHPHISCFCY